MKDTPAHITLAEESSFLIVMFQSHDCSCREQSDEGRETETSLLKKLFSSASVTVCGSFFHFLSDS